VFESPGTAPNISLAGDLCKVLSEDTRGSALLPCRSFRPEYSEFIGVFPAERSHWRPCGCVSIQTSIPCDSTSSYHMSFHIYRPVRSIIIMAAHWQSFLDRGLLIDEI